MFDVRKRSFYSIWSGDPNIRSTFHTSRKAVLAGLYAPHTAHTSHPDSIYSFLCHTGSKNTLVCVFVELCPGLGTDTALTRRRLHGLYSPPPRLCGRPLAINGQRSFLGLINSRYLNNYCCCCCLRAKIVVVKVTNCQIRKANSPTGEETETASNTRSLILASSMRCRILRARGARAFHFSLHFLSRFSPYFLHSDF